MNGLVENVKKYIEDNEMFGEGDRLILGLSGGPDSLCLFDILMKIRDEMGFSLETVHVDHMLRPIESELDRAFVEKLCEEKGVRCTVFVRDCAKIAEETGRTPEEAGRMVRYESFCKAAMALEAEGVAGDRIRIVLAQNRNDQAETILFRLIRGTGTDGLAGMEPLVRGAGGYFVARPLLSTDRKDIEEYCLEEGLEPRIDKTNKETTYTRNRIRLELIPFIDEKFGGDITSAMERLGKNAAEDRDFIAGEAGRLYGRSLIERSIGKIRLERDRLREAHPSVARRAVMRAFRAAGLDQDIERKHLLQAEKLIRGGSSSGSVDFPSGYRLAVSYDEVWAIKDDANDSARENRIPEITKRIMPRKEMAYPEGPGQFACFDADLLEEDLLYGKRFFERLEVRTRQEGDFIMLKAGRKSIQDLFVDMKVPKEYRDDIWLVACGREVLWIPEGECRVRYAEKYSLSASSKRVLMLEMPYQL